MKTVLSILALTLVSTSAFAVPYRNVQVGGSSEFDACGGGGIVLSSTVLFNMNEKGQLNFSDRVSMGQMVASCEEEDGYVGIVYSEKGENCGVGSPIEKRQDYKGPCKSGWIKKELYELLAG